jgi:hypothetical protein
MTHNPFASPSADLEIQRPLTVEEAEALRDRLRIREAAIRSTGSMFYLLATLALVTVVTAALDRWPNLPVVAAAGGLLAVSAAAIGWGLRRLDPRFRFAAAIPAACLLFTFPPSGTAGGLLILYLVLGPGSRPIFSPAYQQLLRQTPYRYDPRSTLVSAALLAFLLVCVIVPFALRWYR